LFETIAISNAFSEVINTNVCKILPFEQKGYKMSIEEESKAFILISVPHFNLVEKISI
jgi:hypothetical protein